MKWTTLLKDLKEKVGLTQQQQQQQQQPSLSSSSSLLSGSSAFSVSSSAGVDDNYNGATHSTPEKRRSYFTTARYGWKFVLFS